MKVELFLLLLGAGMLALNLIRHFQLKKRLPALGAEEAERTLQMSHAAWTQGLVIAGVAWLAAAVLYLGGIHVDYISWQKWFTLTLILLMAGLAGLFPVPHPPPNRPPG